ncbi:hypothetical protein M433DRAFT_150523 [Acidomyces richmondensis BFW]|nr:hypothetical protein M433DRAFT_150523 [Acidomyces richmondensis BFW]
MINFRSIILYNIYNFDETSFGMVTSSERKQRLKTLVSNTTEKVTDLLSSWKIGFSPNGWTSNEYGLEWIKHFHQHTIQKIIGVKRPLGGFQGSGLFPLDPQAVLSKLTLTIRTPSPPLPSYPTSA